MTNITIGLISLKRQATSINRTVFANNRMSFGLDRSIKIPTRRPVQMAGARFKNCIAIKLLSDPESEKTSRCISTSPMQRPAESEKRSAQINVFGALRANISVQLIDNRLGVNMDMVIKYLFLKLIMTMRIIKVMAFYQGLKTATA